MFVGRENIFESIFEKMLDSDLVNLEDFHLDNARECFYDIIRDSFKDYLIVVGDLL